MPIWQDGVGYCLTIKVVLFTLVDAKSATPPFQKGPQPRA